MTTLRKRLAEWLNPPPPPPRKKFCLRVDCQVITLYEVETELVISIVQWFSPDRWGMHKEGSHYLTAKAACTAMLLAGGITWDDVELDGRYIKVNGFES